MRTAAIVNRPIDTAWVRLNLLKVSRFGSGHRCGATPDVR